MDRKKFHQVKREQRTSACGEAPELGVSRAGAGSACQAARAFKRASCRSVYDNALFLRGNIGLDLLPASKQGKTG